MTGPNETIRAAVIGYGLAGSVFHAPLIAATPGMEVAAIVSANDDRRAQAAREHPGAALVARAEDLWADPDAYDLVVVAAANRVHASLAQEAIAAGLAVVVDKPMASNAADARAMADAARAARVMLAPFHNRRWDSDFLTARKLIGEGALGQVLRLESRFERFREAPREGAWRELPDPEEAGGVLWDLGPHLIDQACVLFGDPTHVYAEVEIRRPGARVDDDAFVALRFPGGEVAHLWMSAAAALPGPRLKVSGLRGAFLQEEMDPQEAALRDGGRPDEAGWPRFYAGVRDALRDGGPPPVSAEDGVRAVELVEAAHRSASERSVLRLSA